MLPHVAYTMYAIAGKKLFLYLSVRHMGKVKLELFQRLCKWHSARKGGRR